MTDTIPAPLKIPEVSRFMSRANQLRSIKPAIAYWCEYRAVNQIVGKELHNTDDDCFAFTRTLLERLETTKNERADDDAIIDNEAGQAYVEQFAQETFSRAERTMSANKVTRQTADTFDAAATFFDLLHEWRTPEPEILQKIKFAKWNAARILKAIREGRDPNDTNPNVEEAPPPAEEPQFTDVDDVRLLDQPGSTPMDPLDLDFRQPSSSRGPRGAAVEDAPDGGEPVAGRSEQQQEYFPPTDAPHDTSGGLGIQPPPPLPSPSASTQIRLQPSPQIPTKLPDITPTSPFPPPNPPGQGGWNTQQPPPLHHSQPPTPSPLSQPAHYQQTQPMPPPAASSYQPVPSPAAYHPPVAAPPAQSFQPPPRPVASQKDLGQAQKHAKWAISALNFDDVPTAILELRNALAMLGER